MLNPQQDISATYYNFSKLPPWIISKVSSSFLTENMTLFEFRCLLYFTGKGRWLWWCKAYYTQRRAETKRKKNRDFSPSPDPKFCVRARIAPFSFSPWCVKILLGKSEVSSVSRTVPQRTPLCCQCWFRLEKPKLFVLPNTTRKRTFSDNVSHDKIHQSQQQLYQIGIF